MTSIDQGKRIKELEERNEKLYAANVKLRKELEERNEKLYAANVKLRKQLEAADTGVRDIGEDDEPTSMGEDEMI